jgi:hypothetical protein
MQRTSKLVGKNNVEVGLFLDTRARRASIPTAFEASKESSGGAPSRTPSLFKTVSSTAHPGNILVLRSGRSTCLQFGERRNLAAPCRGNAAGKNVLDKHEFKRPINSNVPF